MQPYDVTEATVPYQRKAMRSFDYGDAIAARHPTANWDTLIGIAYGIKEEYFNGLIGRVNTGRM